MRFENIRVYDLEESIIASGYPMRTELVINHAGDNDLKRAKALTKASATNGAHGQWLTGVRVSFDLTCSNKMWVEAERYRFLEFVSSQSTMHRITKFDLDNQYNEFVDPAIIDIIKHKVEQYNDFIEAIKVGEEQGRSKSLLAVQSEAAKRKYLEILYSNPAGFELTARLTTNYRCLLNIYMQRKNHRLPEWREFCAELLNLPMFKELVNAYVDGGATN